MNTQLFENPDNARFYDLDCPWSKDRTFCVNLAVDARSVLDLGCGTGSLAAQLAAVGRRVVGVDPAAAMLDVALRRPGGHRVEWHEADARTVRLDERFDLIVMTGNAFQVFLADADQLAVCRTIAAHLKPAGRFVFDTREPAREEWREWTPGQSRRTLQDPDLGGVEAWNDARFEPANGICTYETFYRIQASGRLLQTSAQIRFTEKTGIAERLAEAGLAVDLWLGDWDGRLFGADATEIIPVGRLKV